MARALPRGGAVTGEGPTPFVRGLQRALALTVCQRSTGGNLRTLERDLRREIEAEIALVERVAPPRMDFRDAVRRGLAATFGWMT